jgi:hypothetical protein
MDRTTCELALQRNFCEGTEEFLKFSSGVVGAAAEIRTRHITDKREKLCCSSHLSRFVDCCEHDNEHSGSIKGSEFLESSATIISFLS